MIREQGWEPKPSAKYVAVVLANGASDNHSHTYKKYFLSVGEELYKPRSEYKGSKWE